MSTSTMRSFLSLFLGFAACGIFHVNAIAVSEAEQLALEVSGVMLPPKKLTKMFEEDLRAVRKFYPDMEAIQHNPKWIPGELIVSSADDFVIQKLNASRYGPVKKASRISDAANTQQSTYHVVFNKPYHPERLVERVRSELKIQEVEGNLLAVDGNDITYHATAPTYSTYTFSMGWGDCVSSSGCKNKHYWDFSVAPSEETLTVRLEKEYGLDLV